MNGAVDTSKCKNSSHNSNDHREDDLACQGIVASNIGMLERRRHFLTF